MAGRLGYSFVDPSLLELALTHRSWCAENYGYASNERLEFLGDAVLGLVVTQHVYEAMPLLAEGELAKIRASVVNSATLAQVARELDIGPHLLFGKGEAASGGADKDSILADSMEALLGAVYLDGGFEPAESLVMSTLGDRIADSADGPGGNDFKTILQELVVQNFAGLPTYEVVAEGPDHEKQFKAIVYVSGEIRGRGAGRSKKSAEQAAAEQACAALERPELGSEHDVDPAVAGGGAR